jgi:hypothetical protein
MRQILQDTPFLGKGRDYAELDIPGILEAGQARQGLEYGRLTAAAIARHQQRTRSRVIQVEHYRLTIFGHPEQKTSAGQTGRLGWECLSRGCSQGNRKGLARLAGFRLDFMAGFDNRE